jgi:hypothetical protein
MMVADSKQGRLWWATEGWVATNWSRRMWEREERDDMRLEGIRMGMAVKAMRLVG